MNLKTLAVGLGLATAVSGGVVANQVSSQQPQKAKIENVINSLKNDVFESSDINKKSDSRKAVEDIMGISLLGLSGIVGALEIDSKIKENKMDKICKNKGYDVSDFRYENKKPLYMHFVNEMNSKDVKPEKIAEAIKAEIESNQYWLSQEEELCSVGFKEYIEMLKQRNSELKSMLEKCEAEVKA